MLETYPIYYTKAGVNYVGSGCMAVQPCLFESLHNRGIEVNPRRRTDRIIADICQYHLGMGHKILIFENNRTEVRLLAQRLCSELSERGVLKAEKVNPPAGNTSLRKLLFRMMKNCMGLWIKRLPGIFCRDRLS